jgi:signal transduction histidine kinase
MFALLLYNTMPSTTKPVYLHPPHHLHLAAWVMAGVAVAVALPTAWARPRPLPVLGLLLAESMVDTARGASAWQFLLASDVTVCYIAATRSRRTGIVAAAVTLAVWVSNETVRMLIFRNFDWKHLVAGKLVFGLMTVLIAWMSGNSIRQRRDYGEALRAQAITAERLRIARELHDMVAHSIGVIAIQAGAASRVIDTQPAGARTALNAIEATSRETLAGLRRMLGTLRQAGSEPAASDPSPGLADVDRLAMTTADAGVHVDVRWRGERRPLPADIDRSAFRIIQESVTNVVRHADTHRCQVSVEFRDEELSIEVIDDGRGRRAEGTGYGISGMRERVDLLHGHFTAGYRPEGGFRVAARLPVPAGTR